MASAAKSRKLLTERTRLEWVLLILLIVVIYLLLAVLRGWWPADTSKPRLGTAFYSTEEAIQDGNTSSSGTSGSGGSTGGSGGSGGSNGGGNGGGSTSGSSLLDFAATVDTGNSKEEISGQASGLNEQCAVVVNSTTLGKQEVCVYTEGDKIVTVTYLNDRVISASRSGF